MKRYLIAIAALGVVFAANAAFADNNWAFDDTYWKEAPSVQAITAEQPARSKYYLVDDFNP